MLLARRLHPEELAPAPDAPRLDPAARTAEGAVLAAENAALRARVAELEALLAAATEPPARPAKR